MRKVSRTFVTSNQPFKSTCEIPCSLRKLAQIFLALLFWPPESFKSRNVTFLTISTWKIRLKKLFITTAKNVEVNVLFKVVAPKNFIHRIQSQCYMTQRLMLGKTGVELISKATHDFNASSTLNLKVNVSLLVSSAIFPQGHTQRMGGAGFTLKRLTAKG